jgi:hypothetical protein
MDNPSQQSASCEFFLPWWWVNAFEYAHLNSISPLEQVQKSQFAPALSAVELSYLAIVLAEVQTAVLSGQEEVVLTASGLRKLLPSQTTYSRKIFENLLLLLPKIEVLAPSDVGFIRVPIFADFAYGQTKEGEDFEIALAPSPEGFECILGLYEPYSDLLRYQNKKVRNAVYWPGESPLCLNRPTWLEFAEGQKRFLVNLEKAVQWHANWLRLDGIFGDDVFKVMGMNLPATKPSFIKMAGQLTQMGKKLCDHGVLTKSIDTDFMAFEKKQGFGVTIAWQVPWDRIYAKELKSYRDQASLSLTKLRYRAHLPAIVSILLGEEAEESLLHTLDGLVKKSLEQFPDAATKTLVAYRKDAPLTAVSLFIEWVLRYNFRTSHPLPEWVRSSDIILAIRLDSEETMLANLQKFVEFFSENEDFVRDVEADESCLVLKKLARGDVPIPVSKRRVKLPPVKLVTEEIPERVGASAAPVDDERVQRKLKQAILEEIEAMKKNHPKKYVELKKKYIESLDEKSRSIIIEVQKRLDAGAFDAQLKNSLVKFLMGSRRAEHTA